MHRTIWGATGLALIGVFALFTAGCSSAAPPPTTDVVESLNLRELGELYRSYVLAKKKSPKAMADLREYEAGYPMAMLGLRERQLEVYWGGDLVDAEAIQPGSSPSDKVLAFEAKVPKEGGYVMLANREVKKMTPEEFQAAPKAADSASSAGKGKTNKAGL